MEVRKNLSSVLVIAWIVTLLSGWQLVHWNAYFVSSHQPPSTTTGTQSNSALHKSGLHFCQAPKVKHNNATLRLLYQCSGRPYEEFARQLHDLAEVVSSGNNNNNSQYWGRRPFPLPKDASVLVLGNSHLRQISKTIVCQYAHVIDHIHMESADSFTVTFANNATWISLTNTVLVYSPEWNKLMEEEIIFPQSNRTFDQMDALVFGKFTGYEEALHTNYEHTMKEEQQAYYQRHQNNNSSNNNNTRLDFANYPPPQLLTAAKVFSRPIVAVSMFAITDEARARKSRHDFTLEVPQNNNTVHFVDSRHYVNAVGLECGSDDKHIMGTCHEPGDIIPNSNRNPADMHRCAGPLGGHADLVAWDVIERLYESLT
jgi:hypothetical protein